MELAVNTKKLNIPRLIDDYSEIMKSMKRLAELYEKENLERLSACAATESVETRNKELTKQLNESRKKNVELEKQVEELRRYNSEIAGTKSKYDILLKKTENTDVELEQLTVKLQTEINASSHAKEENENLKLELEKTRTERDQINRKASRHWQRIEKLRVDLSKEKGRYKKLKEQIESLKANRNKFDPEKPKDSVKRDQKKIRHHVKRMKAPKPVAKEYNALKISPVV